MDFVSFGKFQANRNCSVTITNYKTSAHKVVTSRVTKTIRKGDYLILKATQTFNEN